MQTSARNLIEIKDLACSEYKDKQIRPNNVKNFDRC